MKRFVLLFVLALMVVSCTPATPVPTATPIPPTAIPAPFALSSSAFTEGQEIPVDYSCKGINISPALSWTEPPAGTQSFAIIMEDPSASWVHWVIYNIPASTRELQEHLPTNLSDGSLQASTSFGRPGYGGPCPPETHEYVFTLYAVDNTIPELSAGRGKNTLLKEMEGHILASVELKGLFTP